MVSLCCCSEELRSAKFWYAAPEVAKEDVHLKDKALILGSAPNSMALGSEGLENYHKIAINKSWRLRRDFDTHVFLRSLTEGERTTTSIGMRRVRRR